MNALVSIIVAMYNVEEYIEKCISSIINQSYKNLEIIIINDESTDKSLEIVENFTLQDTRIKIINQSNQGISRVRYNGLQNAKGDYILFVDGDDWLEKDTIKKLYQEAVLTNSDIVLFDFYRCIGEVREKTKCNYLSLDEKDYLEKLFMNHIVPTVWTKFIKKEFLDSIKQPLCLGVDFAEDLVTSTIWFLHNPRVTYLNEYLYNYYRRSDSVTVNIDKRILGINKALLEVQNMLDAKGVLQRYQTSFEYTVYLHLFESKILALEGNSSFKSILYKDFKKYKINSKNKHIIDRIQGYSFLLKIRAKIYLNSYFSGQMYDKLRQSLKKLKSA